MTTVAIVVINLASRGLLGIEAKFGIRFAALHIATGEHKTCTEANANRYLCAVSHSGRPSTRLTMIEEI